MKTEPNHEGFKCFKCGENKVDCICEFNEYKVGYNKALDEVEKILDTTPLGLQYNILKNYRTFIKQKLKQLREK